MNKLAWGDAQVWMDASVRIYNNAGDERGARYPKENEFNVAYVCAGYAFELIFKILVNLSGTIPTAKHEPSVAFGKMAVKYRAEVKRIVIKHGWKDIGAFLDHLDNNLCHKDRKYWMRPPQGGPASAWFQLGGIRGIKALGQLHGALSNFVLEAIENDSDVHEVWSVKKWEGIGSGNR